MASPQCIVLAGVGGLCTTFGVNVMQYKSHLEKCGRRVFSPIENTCCVCINLLMSAASIVFFVLATGHGPVSVAMPILSASCLLGNMVVQVALGIERFSKSMYVGTWVLVVAIMCLIDIGPAAQHFDDPLSLLMTTPGAVSMLVQLALVISSTVGILVLKKAKPSSLPKIFSYAFLVAASTAMSASIGKLMQMDLELIPRLSCITGYVILGAMSFVGAVMAASETDGSTYLPVRSCVQLLLNAATGLCVWQDWRTITSWTAYVSVYILIVLGVYDVSAFDLAHIFGDVGKYKTPVAKLQFTRAATTLAESPLTDDLDVKGLEAIEDMLTHGLKSRQISKEDLLALTMALLEKHKDGESVACWMEHHWHFKNYYEKSSAGFLPRARTNLYQPPAP